MATHTPRQDSENNRNLRKPGVLVDVAYSDYQKKIIRDRHYGPSDQTQIHSSSAILNIGGRLHNPRSSWNHYRREAPTETTFGATNQPYRLSEVLPTKMALSDETVRLVLETLTKTLEEMRISAKENSDLNKEIMGFLREKVVAQAETTVPKQE